MAKLLKIRRKVLAPGFAGRREPKDQTSLLSAYRVRSTEDFPDIISVDTLHASEHGGTESYHMQLSLEEFETLYRNAVEIVDLTAY